MRLIDTDKLKFPNIAIFDMKLHGVTVPMVRLIDLQELIPTVDAVPVVHGRWISDEAYGHIKIVNGIPDGSCICSVCGKWLTGSDEYDVYGNYCPACGAKMDLEGQDAKEET